VALSSAIQSSSSAAASACNQIGTFYGDPVTYGGETYQTVVICDQTWMAKNLNYNASGSKCYSNVEADCNKYGRLYDWATAMNLPSSCNSSSCSSQVQSKHMGICPSGWHIPSDAEWDALMTAVGSTAGKKLKATSDWNDNGNGTDDFGFAALPGGLGYSNGNFNNAGGSGLWWSSSEFNALSAYRRSMSYYSENVLRNNIDKTFLHSVRCLQDSAP
jgi:uncharacterized protein (TIGR02145 family)